MQKRQSISQKITYWLKVVSLGLILGLGLQFAQGWTAPTDVPPGGNVAGPITTGGNQIKTGTLTTGGLASPVFVDSDNVNYSLNPSSLTTLNNLRVTSLNQGSCDLKADGFWGICIAERIRSEETVDRPQELSLPGVWE
ncbi:MAG: hypothetical protein NC829_01370 [Candidatus Omnitrophica bacterium]|nr:hypothetical protein [Candidatus Omnitrophota bacterium]